MIAARRTGWYILRILAGLGFAGLLVRIAYLFGGGLLTSETIELSYSVCAELTCAWALWHSTTSLRALARQTRPAETKPLETGS